MSDSSLRQRLGQHAGQIIDNDFPNDARIALSYLLDDLFEKGFLVKKEEIIRELNRIGRITKGDLEQTSNKSFINQVSVRINQFDWPQVYFFCERLYDKLLKPVVYDYIEITSLEEEREYFSKEINTILEEENLAFRFIDGKFHRKGRAQTQKVIARTSTVLSDPRLSKVKYHFNKAREFFDKRPMPDNENCIKEALCSLEACIEILTTKSASQDFPKAVRQLQGNKPRQIPAPIVEGMIKLHGYRGSGEGVSHAALEGTRVSTLESELILSLAASYITYLVDLFTPEDDIPF